MDSRRLVSDAQPVTTKHLHALFPRLTEMVIAGYVIPLGAALVEFSITTPPRISAFLAQLGHESAGLTCWVEDLHYRPETLAKLFARCRDTHGNPTWGAIEACRRGPEAVAELIYGDREDLGNVEPGDGWRFRGRGPIRVTGRANYKRTGAVLEVDLEAQPALLETPQYGFRSAGLYWMSRGLNDLADRETDNAYKFISRRINGGLAGLDDRVGRWREARAVFGLPMPVKMESAEEWAERIAADVYDVPAIEGRDDFKDAMRAVLEARDAAIRAKGYREGLEKAAEYVATHYPAQITGQAGPSRWVMDATTDGGATQREYAKAIRAEIERSAAEGGKD